MFKQKQSICFLSLSYSWFGLIKAKMASLIDHRLVFTLPSLHWDDKKSFLFILTLSYKILFSLYREKHLEANSEIRYNFLKFSFLVLFSLIFDNVLPRGKLLRVCLWFSIVYKGPWIFFLMSPLRCRDKSECWNFFNTEICWRSLFANINGARSFNRSNQIYITLVVHHLKRYRCYV